MKVPFVAQAVVAWLDDSDFIVEPLDEAELLSRLR
jgi:hypothetical protein